MRTEIIKNPDIECGLLYGLDFSPKLSHFEVRHDNTIIWSSDTIINNLVVNGWEVHGTQTKFFMGYPASVFTLKKLFLAKERDEYEIRLEDDGFLRFRFEYSNTIYLTLLYIHADKQGQGLGRKWFLPVTDALFRAGVRSMRGAVSPSYYKSKKPMDVARLTRFYVREVGFVSTGDGYITKTSPYIKQPTPAAA